MYGYIYKFTLIPTGKIYVGKHKSEIFDESYYGSGFYWIPEVEKYGKDNVNREILEWCDTMDLLDEREKFWIKELNARDPNIGYNKSPGGYSGDYPGELNGMWGRHHSIETKRKISEKKIGKLHTEEFKLRVSKKLKGKTFSKERNKKVSESLKGHVVSEETRKKLSIAAKNRPPISDETRKKLSLPGEKNGMYGYKWSDEQRKHMHDVLAGRKLTDEQRKKWSEVQIGKKLYTNGVIRKWVYPNQEIPEGFMLNSDYKKLSGEERSEFRSRVC